MVRLGLSLCIEGSGDLTFQRSVVDAPFGSSVGLWFVFEGVLLTGILFLVLRHVIDKHPRQSRRKEKLFSQRRTNFGSVVNMVKRSMSRTPFYTKKFRSCLI